MAKVASKNGNKEEKDFSVDYYDFPVEEILLVAVEKETEIGSYPCFFNLRMVFIYRHKHDEGYSNSPY